MTAPSAKMEKLHKRIRRFLKKENPQAKALLVSDGNEGHRIEVTLEEVRAIPEGLVFNDRPVLCVVLDDSLLPVYVLTDDRELGQAPIACYEFDLIEGDNTATYYVRDNLKKITDLVPFDKNYRFTYWMACIDDKPRQWEKSGALMLTELPRQTLDWIKGAQADDPEELLDTALLGDEADEELAVAK